MLRDFLLLELYYGSVDSAQYLEDVVHRYGKESLEKARVCGDVVMRKMLLGPDRGRMVCWLSELGRDKATQFMTSLPS